MYCTEKLCEKDTLRVLRAAKEGWNSAEEPKNDLRIGGGEFIRRKGRAGRHKDN